MAPFSRTRQAQTSEPAQRVTIASAVLVRQSDVRKIPKTADWQSQAWGYYDTVPELRFACTWMSNVLSRVRLYIGRPDPSGQGDPAPVNPDDPDTGDERALVPLRELFGGPSGHGQMLARLAVHLSLPGESYLVGMDSPVDGGGTERRWIVASGDEFSTKGRKVTVRLPESDEQVEVDLDNASTTVIRLWRPHARRAWEADSPVRALLPVLKELLDLGAHITASVESRLAGAGMLFLPASATAPTAAAAQQGGTTPLHDNHIMAAMIDAMVTPIGDRDAASAVVPILVTVPDETEAKPYFLSFATPLDAKVQELRKDAIRRLAIGVDMPPEVLLGMGESSANHWTAWQIDEASIKVHAAAMLTLLASALTERWYRPALQSLAIPNPNDYVVWYDLSEVALRPNRTTEALTLNEQGKVSDAATLREAGFGDDDAPDDAEKRRWLLGKLALSGVAPATAAPYLKALGITIEVPDAEEQDGTGGGAGGPAGDADTTRDELPTTPGAPGTELVPASLVDGWALTALEMGAVRALEFAGKRMLNWAGRAWRGRINCPAHEIHVQIPAADHDVDKLLDGAYTLLDDVFKAQPALRYVVDDYVRGLLANQRRHSRQALALALTAAGCATVLPGGVHAA